MSEPPEELVEFMDRAFCEPTVSYPVGSFLSHIERALTAAHDAGLIFYAGELERELAQ